MNDFLIILVTFIATSIGIGFSEYNHRNDKEIGAMEVYKGNTTLEYKVVDGVKVDSCVIFLKK